MKKDPIKVTAEMIRAAQAAEFYAYYPDKKMTDFTWQGTNAQTMRKIIEAALAAMP